MKFKSFAEEFEAMLKTTPAEVLRKEWDATVREYGNTGITVDQVLDYIKDRSSEISFSPKDYHETKIEIANKAQYELGFLI